MPFFRRLEQSLSQNFYFFDPYRKFTGFGSAQLSSDTDKVAKFKKFDNFPLLAKLTFAQADLHSAAGITESNKYQFADVTMKHDSACT